MLVDILLDNFQVKEFMEENGFKMKHIGGNTVYITTCPFCGKEEHCGINPKKKFFGCYKCHTAGNFIKLIQQVLDRTFVEVLEFLKTGANAKHLDINRINSILTEFKPVETEILKRTKPIALPEGYSSLYNKRIPYLDTGRTFPIPQDQINYYRMGICTYGFYNTRLIICDVNDKQEVIYWIARDTTGEAPKKYKVLNPNAEMNRVGSSDILFNFYLARNYPVGVITEGLFDALHVGNNGLATYGEGLKKNHLYWLLMANFEEIVLLYDADVSDEKLEKSGKMLSQFFNTRICKLPSGDPDEWSKEHLKGFIDAAPPFAPSELLKVCPDIYQNKEKPKWNFQKKKK